MHLYAADSTEKIDGIQLFFPAIYDIVWSVIPFGLLVLFFALFVVPKFLKTLDARSAAIEGGIAKAAAVQQEADQKLEEYNQQLNEARDEAARIREQARQDGVKILTELKTSAGAESERILANAQTQIEAERQAALVSLKSEVGSLALDLAGGILNESLSSDVKAKAVVDDFVKELSAKDAKTGSKA